MIRIGNLSPAMKQAAASTWAELVQEAGDAAVDLFETTLPKRSDYRIELEHVLTEAAMADGNPELSMTELRAGMKQFIDVGTSEDNAVPPELFRPETMRIGDYRDNVTLAPRPPSIAGDRTGEQVSLRSEDGSLEVRLIKMHDVRGGQWWYAPIDHASTLGPSDEVVALPQPFDEVGARQLIRMLDLLQSNDRRAGPGQRLVNEFLAKAEKKIGSSNSRSHTRLLQSFAANYRSNGELDDAIRVATTLTGVSQSDARLAGWKMLVELHAETGNDAERDRAQQMVDRLS